MEKFTQHKGIIAPLDTANVDTDQIIAKQFLKSIKRTGFGEHLFHDWRYDDSGKANADFSLNNPAFNGASILVARNNFGCGSSREHAVWAVMQYGFRAVIAPSKGEIPGFADIFRNNSVKNGLLTIQLSEKEVDQIFDAINANPGIEASIDLEKQTLSLAAPASLEFKFETDASTRTRLLEGLDDIGITLGEVATIDSFEKTYDAQTPVAN